MSFFALILHNQLARKVRTTLTAVAVAVGVATVVTLGVVTHSLRTTAGAVLKTGKADFTIAQKGVSDVLNSTINEGQLARISRYPGIQSTVGALVATTKLNSANPLFLEIGVPADRLQPFGVQILTGQAYAPNATNQLMLGRDAADSLGKRVGDTITIDSNTFQITGTYTVGNTFGDSGAMLPLPALQANERKPSDVTLVFVRTVRGTTPAQRSALRKRIEHDFPSLATVRLAVEFGRVDRNLDFINAADKGATLLALVIGAVIVMNTMLLSFFERTREFGVLRAVGWRRSRVMALVIGEVLVISLIGAGFGIGLSFLAVTILEHLSTLRGILHSDFTPALFLRALYLAAGIGLLGALYPAARAALLRPLVALRSE